MHEMSLATEVCRMAREHLAACGAESSGAAVPPCLVGVGLEVGDDAGVELESLRFCLEVMLASPPFEGATVELLRVPGDVLRLSYLEVEDGGADD